MSGGDIHRADNEQTVVVEYTHLADGYLEAKVLLNGVDIGSQMLRDGAAWYDRSFEYTLSESDRELYARCEQMARDEKRGLWQDGMAVAPWEFRKAQQTAKIKPEVNFNSVRAAMTSRAANRGKSLSIQTCWRNIALLAGGYPSSAVWPDSPPDDWHTFHSVHRFFHSYRGATASIQYPVA